MATSVTVSTFTHIIQYFNMILSKVILLLPRQSIATLNISKGMSYFTQINISQCRKNDLFFKEHLIFDNLVLWNLLKSKTHLTESISLWRSVKLMQFHKSRKLIIYLIFCWMSINYVCMLFVVMSRLLSCLHVLYCTLKNCNTITPIN